ncbi:MAG: ABC transporter ATP-binding protein [Burkholderiaceae bacterium]
MSSIILKNLTVDFPIYGAGSRSLKKTFLRSATGGKVARDASDKIVVRALDNINLHLQEGDRVGIYGHNGSGKSTLLKVMAGVYEPVSGSCETKGRLSSMLNLLLGMHPDSSGYENIFLRGKILGLTPQEIDTITQDVVAFAGLGEYMDMPLRTYSSGMAMRLGFSVSTAIPADILLMDEWMSVGDAEFMEKANARLAALLDTAKILVLASHSEETIRKNCNKLIRLDHGQIVAVEAI